MEGKRFIGISEPPEQHGEVFIMSGKPLRMNDRSKEIIEQVRRIEFPEAH